MSEDVPGFVEVLADGYRVDVRMRTPSLAEGMTMFWVALVIWVVAAVLFGGGVLTVAGTTVLSATLAVLWMGVYSQRLSDRNARAVRVTRDAVTIELALLPPRVVSFADLDVEETDLGIRLGEHRVIVQDEARRSWLARDLRGRAERFGGTSDVPEQVQQLGRAGRKHRPTGSGNPVRRLRPRTGR